jgi:hypothetical protein
MPDPDGHGCEVSPATPEQISVPCFIFVFVTYRLTFWAGHRRLPNLIQSRAD